MRRRKSSAAIISNTAFAKLVLLGLGLLALYLLRRYDIFSWLMQALPGIPEANAAAVPEASALDVIAKCVVPKGLMATKILPQSIYRGAHIRLFIEGQDTAPRNRLAFLTEYPESLQGKGRELNQKLNEFVLAYKKHTQENTKQINRIIQNRKLFLTLQDRATLRELFSTLDVSQAAKQSGVMSCSASVRIAMGRIIFQHLKANTPIPALIALGFSSDIPDNLEVDLVGYHMVFNHMLLLVVPQRPGNGILLDQLRKQINQKIAPEKYYQIIKALDPTVCDAWKGDTDPLNAPRAKDDLLTVLNAEPWRIPANRISLVMWPDLMTPAIKPIVEWVFDQHRDFWKSFKSPSAHCTNKDAETNFGSLPKCSM
ncbi:MAG: hypothetical protein K0U12_01965 [Gammaproteobacteria bacterium]|nr:hypothetical protein [Gammaproteobacteria bacterium]